jgi:hypothetical protein
VCSCTEAYMGTNCELGVYQMGVYILM